MTLPSNRAAAKVANLYFIFLRLMMRAISRITGLRCCPKKRIALDDPPIYLGEFVDQEVIAVDPGEQREDAPAQEVHRRAKPASTTFSGTLEEPLSGKP